MEKYNKPVLKKTKACYKDSYSKKANCSGNNNSISLFMISKPGK